MAVTEKIKAEFDASSASAYSRALGGLGNMAQGVSRQMSGLLSGANLLKASLAGVASGVTLHGIGKVGAEFENVQTRLAGTLSALDFAPTFTAGLTQAKGVMDSLYAAAAKLPGETEDYIEVFTSALPVLQNVKGGLAGMTEYANRYTAVMKSMGIDTGEAAMNLQRMLAAGQATAESRSPAFRQLSNYMRAIPGQANLTAASFNKMSQAMRTELLEKTLAKMGPMVDHMQTSWDAVSGAMASAGRLLFRQATSPLFDSMKKSMSGVADMILDSKGHLTRFGETVAAVGQAISKHLGGALERAVAAMQGMAGNIGAVLNRLKDNPVVGLLDKVLSRGATMVQGIMGAATGAPNKLGNAAAGAGVAGMAFGPIGALIGGLAGFKNVMHVADALVTTFLNLIDAVAPAAQAIGSTLARAIDAIIPIFDDLSPALTQLFQTVGAFTEAVLPLVDIFMSVAKILGPTMGLIAMSLEGWQLIFEGIGTALDGFAMMVKTTTAFIRTIYRAFTMGHDEYKAAQQRDANEKEAAGIKRDVHGPLSDFIGKLANLKMPDYAASIEGAGKNVKVPAVRPGTKVVQDFRGSRFSIQQDFAKDFDPERIVVAFTKDLERAAEQRRQSSGFSPIFGVS